MGPIYASDPERGMHTDLLNWTEAISVLPMLNPCNLLQKQVVNPIVYF